MSRRIGQFATLAGLLFIGGTTLVPLPQQSAAAAATPLWCLVCGEYGGVDVLNNILLFLPFGFGLRLLGMPTARVVLLGLVVSLGVELLQLTVIPGRDASLSDLLTNTLGAWIGAIACTHRRQLVLPGPRKAAQLALSLVVIWLGVQAATAILLRPWAPGKIRGGAWGRVVFGRSTFDGTVMAAAVSGRPVGDKVAPIPELAPKLRQGAVELEVDLLSGSNRAIWSPVFELLGPRGSVLSLEALANDLAFQPPLQSSRLLLRRPALRLPGALPARPGTPVRVWAGLRGDTLAGRWSIAEGRISQSLQVLGPSLGWSLITPFSYAFGPDARWLTGVWIAGWLGIIGYWWTATRARALVLTASLGLLLIAGLAVVPLLFGYPPGDWTEWLGGAAGAAIGCAGHHFATYLGQRCDPLSTRESC